MIALWWLLLRPRLLFKIVVGGVLVAAIVGFPVVDALSGFIPTDWSTLIPSDWTNWL